METVKLQEIAESILTDTVGKGVSLLIVFPTGQD